MLLSLIPISTKALQTVVSARDNAPEISDNMTLFAADYRPLPVGYLKQEWMV